LLGSRFTLVVASLTLLLAGCTEPEAGTVLSASPSDGLGTGPTSEGSGEGVVVGSVNDDSQIPLPDVQVIETGSGAMTRSDENGQFKLEGIPIGEAKIAAAKAGYSAASMKVQVDDAAPTEVHLTLVAISMNVPYSVTQTKTAYIECALYTGVYGTDCNTLRNAGAPLPEDRSVAKWNFGDLNGTSGMWLETVWTKTNDLGRYLSVYWAYDPPEKTRSQLSSKQGESPLRIRLAPEGIKRLDQPGITCEAEGCKMKSGHSTWKSAVNTGDPERVGFVYQQRIDDWATVFYYGEFPTDFTAIQAGG
jgi:hypothetical protein